MSPAEARRHCFRNAIEHVHLGHRAAMGPGMPQGYERNLRRIHVSRIVSTSVCQSVGPDPILAERGVTARDGRRATADGRSDLPRVSRRWLSGLV
jgi:hypothetical protein